MRIENLEQLRELAARTDAAFNEGNGNPTFVRRDIAGREVRRLEQIAGEISGKIFEVEQNLAEVGVHIEIVLSVRIKPS